MAIRNILEYGDPTLHKLSKPVTAFDARLHRLLDDMADTMRHANGVGLAAPQVGVLRRVALIEVDEEQGIIELINPEIVKQSGEQTGVEGCLSVPGRYGFVTRPMAVTVRAQNRDGDFFEVSGEGLCARAFCHELEHLDGTLFVTHAARLLSAEELDEMAEQEEDN